MCKFLSYQSYLFVHYALFTKLIYSYFLFFSIFINDNSIFIYLVGFINGLIDNFFFIYNILLTFFNYFLFCSLIIKIYINLSTCILIYSILLFISKCIFSNSLFFRNIYFFTIFSNIIRFSFFIHFDLLFLSILINDKILLDLNLYQNMFTFSISVTIFYVLSKTT